MSLPGKKFRKQILIAFNVRLRIDERPFSIIDRVVGMLHNASLLQVLKLINLVPTKGINLYMIDDIQDRSQLRRGFPATHRIFGTVQSINAGNYTYFLAQTEPLHLDDPSQAICIHNKEMLNLHRRQGIELFWRDSMTVPTEDECLLMSSNKTGGLLRLVVSLMQSVSSTRHNSLPLTDLIGLMLQLRSKFVNMQRRSCQCPQSSG